MVCIMPDVHAWLCLPINGTLLPAPGQGANGQQELTKLVAENLLAFDRQFWFRLATRSDGAQSSAERETLTNLANVRPLPALALCTCTPGLCLA